MKSEVKCEILKTICVLEIQSKMYIIKQIIDNFY